jgi:hypothetical protein
MYFARIEQYCLERRRELTECKNRTAAAVPPVVRVSAISICALLNTLSDGRVPVVEQSLHVVSDFLGCPRTEHIVVPAVAVVHLLLHNNGGLEKPRNRTIRRRSLAIQSVCDVVGGESVPCLLRR